MKTIHSVQVFFGMKEERRSFVNIAAMISPAKFCHPNFSFLHIVYTASIHPPFVRNLLCGSYIFDVYIGDSVDLERA